MLTLLLISFFLLLTGGGLAALWPYRQGAPVFWFPVALALMAIGTVPLVDLRLTSDQVYIAMFATAMVSFFAATWLSILIYPMRQNLMKYARTEEAKFSEDEVWICVIFFIISIVITILYYRAVGYNVMWLLLSGQVEDYSTLRIESYSGVDYFAPGYVNQFKNVLLPVTALILSVFLAENSRKELFWSFIVIAWPIVFIAVAGTGQRAFLVYSFAAVVMAFSLRNAGKIQSKGRSNLVLIGIPVIALFSLMTGAYAGIDEGGVGAIIAKGVERFTSIQQEGGLFGFRYIYMLQTAWFSEWWQGVVGILPSVEGSTLSHEIYAILYGTDRGTAPLASVGSAYYNGGILGVILLFSVMGFIYSYLYRRFLVGRKSVARTFTYGFLFLYLAIYVADAPTILLDNGVLTLMIFLILLKGRRPFRTKSDREYTGRLVSRQQANF